MGWSSKYIFIHGGFSSNRHVSLPEGKLASSKNHSHEAYKDLAT